MPMQDPNAQGAPPQAPPGGGGGAPPPEPGATPPDAANPPQEAAGGEQFLQPIQEMSDMIVQLAGPEVLAQILEGGLQQIMQSQGGQGQQGPPVEAAAAPVPGGEAFGAFDR
jgi:hypothetical protein